MDVAEIAPNPRGGFRRLFRLDSPNGVSGGDASNLPAPVGRRKAVPALHVVHVNDAHHFHFGQRPSDQDAPVPVAHLADFLHSCRAAAEAAGEEVIYISAGDEHTGTSLDELLGYAPCEFTLSAGYAVQSVLGLDAATIGNHDLDRGPEILEVAITENAAFPLLGANIVRSRFLRTYAPAVVGVTPRGTRVGIIGVTTDEQLQVRPTQDPDFVVTDPLDVAVTWYRALESHVDILVVLSHLGLNVPGSRHTSRVDDHALAEALADHRVAGARPLCIIGGHTHTVINPETAPVTIRGIPVFQTGANLQHLGVVTISRGVIRGELVAIESRQSGNDEAREQREARELRTAITGKLAHTVLRSVTTIRAGHTADPTTTLEDRLTSECGIANMITDALQRRFAELETIPVVVATDASGVQSGIISPPNASVKLRIDDLYRILPYADSVYRAMLTPEQLLAILHSNARRILPRSSLKTRGGSVGLIDWAQIARGFLHFSGNLRYCISGTTDSTNATLDGVPLEHTGDPQSRIAVYCNSFSAKGNQGWGLTDDDSFIEFGSVSLPALGFTDTGTPLRVALIESLRREASIPIVRDGRLTVSASVQE